MFKIFPFLNPPAYPDYNIPPTLYSVLNSIVNYNNPDKVKISDLAKNARGEIFDFNYPLSTHINKEDFECMILNHFIERRIGRETVTAFKLALNVKLNEIMPVYNKMFDMLDGWDLFLDGEVVTEIGNTHLENSTTNSTTNDRRYSDTPEGHLTEVQDGTYLTDYNYDTTSGNINNESTGNDTRTIRKTPSDKIKIYKEFIETRESIYTLIFKDLDPLFYGLI